MVAVTSARATVHASAFVTNSVSRGQVFMPMHYETMNRLTFASFDPFSRQPAYKACAVRIARLEGANA
jgi:assimilatory nitrate reductase catalytic subunit